MSLKRKVMLLENIIKQKECTVEMLEILVKDGLDFKKISRKEM